MGGIRKVSIKHEAILDYLMMNPQVRLQDVAAYFKITQPWLSQIIHSDAFQAKLREKQEVAFHHTVLPLREKMMTVAHIALDKLVEQLPLETETKTTSQVMESVLDRLGFSPKSVGTSVNINANGGSVQVAVLQQEVSEARELLFKAAGANANGDTHASREVQPKSLPSLGISDPLAPFSSTSSEKCETEARVQV